MRTMILASIAFGVLCCGTAIAQSAPTGNWSATYTDASGAARDAALAIAGDKGTFRIFAQGRGAKNNPCLGRDLPVSVQSSGDDLILVVSASQAMQGCDDFTATLKRVDDSAFAGTIANARNIRITRK